MKILVIGQAPSRTSNIYSRHLAWSRGPSARRLWKWFKVQNRNELLSVADLTHAIPWLEGVDKKGDKIPTDRLVLARLKRRLIAKFRYNRYRKVILVGKFAENLISDYLIENRIKYICLPHPSGVNIKCNGQDSNIKRRITNFLKEEK